MVRHLDVGSSHPGVVSDTKGVAVLHFKEERELGSYRGDTGRILSIERK